MRDHRKLKAFRLADELALTVYQVTEVFPQREIYGLTSQMRRAAVSVATNIVEGCARQTERDFVNFLTIAFGSLRELGYLCSLAERLGYLAGEKAQPIHQLQHRCASTLGGLIRSFQQGRRS